MLLQILLHNAVSIFALLLLMGLIHKNITLEKRTILFYSIAILLCVCAIIFKFLELYFFYSAKTTGAVFQTYIFRACSTAIAPFIPVVLSFIYTEQLGKKSAFLLIVPAASAVLALSSPWTGLYITAYGSRVLNTGPLFFIYILTLAYSFVVLIITNMKIFRRTDKTGKIFFSLLLFFAVVSTVVQLVLPHTHTVWQCIAMALILYYVFLREFDYCCDVLTKAFNRQAFDKRINEMKNSEKAVILVLDLDNLKITNDTYGHLVGDIYIKNAAKVIIDCFNDIGQVYRIGGDEFCVLSDDFKSGEAVNDAIIKMLAKIENLRSYYDMQIGISYGLSVYRKNEEKDIYDVFSQADKNMYVYKARLKENYKNNHAK